MPKTNKIYYWIVFFIIFLLIIYILSYVQYTFNILEYDNNHIIFLNNKQLTNFLIQDNDNYYNSFNQLDFQVRKISSPEDYGLLIEKSCRDFTTYEKNKIVRCINILETIMGKIKYPWFDGEKAMKTQWKFGCIQGKLYEEGLPHTRFDVIVIPEKCIRLYSTRQLCKLILHEKTHVYQKLYTNDSEKYVHYHNFYKYSKRSDIHGTRANPDLNEWIYNNSDNKSYIALYNNNPKDILDVTYHPINKAEYEHPYEQMAYEIQEYTNKIPIINFYW